MLTRSLATLSACAVLLLTAVTSWSQTDASALVRVDVKEIKFAQTFTPQYSGSNIVDKRWRPKPWMEVDMDLEVLKAKTNPDKGPFVDELELKVFVALNKTNPTTGQYIMLTMTQSYVNALVRESNRVLLYASPKALMRILEKDFSNTDVRAVGVEVYAGGQMIGRHSSVNAIFWEKLDSFETLDKILLPKEKTPFAPLWGDYDLETKK